MRMPHTGTHRGKRVKVILKNGQSFIDRFYERCDRYVFFQQYGKVAKSEIKAFILIKKQEEVSNGR